MMLDSGGMDGRSYYDYPSIFTLCESTQKHFHTDAPGAAV